MYTGNRADATSHATSFPGVLGVLACAVFCFIFAFFVFFC